MGWIALFLLIVGPAIAQPGPATSRPSSLTAVCPVDWRGAPLDDALGELASRLEVSYVLDSSVDAAALARTVRMSASHLTGEEALRWLARSAGLAAVRIDDVFVIAAEERLPAVWRTRVVRDGVLPAGDDPRRRRLLEGRAGINWVDSPLSGVAQDISAGFGVDVVFHPAILDGQKLVYLVEDSQVGFDRVRDALQVQLGARVSFFDGAVWVGPADVVPAPRVTTRPAGGDKKARDRASRSLSRRVRIDRSVTSWAAFADRLGEAGGLGHRIEVPPAASYPMIEAVGSVEAVLQAARLLGWLSWQLEPPVPADGTVTVKIQIHEKDQSN